MNRKSFTLPEIMVMGAVGMMLFGGLLSILSSAIKGGQHGSEKLKSLQSMAFFLETFQYDIQNATEVGLTDKSSVKFKTSMFSKIAKKKVNFRVEYKFVAKENQAWLERTPTVDSGSLPEDIRAGKVITEGLKSFEFLDFKDDLGVTLPDNRRGFAIKVKFFDNLTKAQFDFQRSFYPPLLPQNNPGDEFQEIK